MIGLLSFLRLNILLYIIPPFLYPLVSGHVGCSYPLATVNTGSEHVGADISSRSRFQAFWVHAQNSVCALPPFEEEEGDVRSGAEQSRGCFRNKSHTQMLSGLPCKAIVQLMAYRCCREQ